MGHKNLLIYIMKKTLIPAFVFISGVSMGAWLVVSGEFFGNKIVYSNSDTVCKVENFTTQSECTGGSWSTWDLTSHTQTYNGFIYTTEMQKIWYKLPHNACGYKKRNVELGVTSEPCTMIRTDNGEPDTGVSTENVPATCENC